MYHIVRVTLLVIIFSTITHGHLYDCVRTGDSFRYINNSNYLTGTEIYSYNFSNGSYNKAVVVETPWYVKPYSTSVGLLLVNNPHANVTNLGTVYTNYIDRSSRYGFLERTGYSTTFYNDTLYIIGGVIYNGNYVFPQYVSYSSNRTVGSLNYVVNRTADISFFTPYISTGEEPTLIVITKPSLITYYSSTMTMNITTSLRIEEACIYDNFMYVVSNNTLYSYNFVSLFYNQTQVPKPITSIPSGTNRNIKCLGPNIIITIGDNAEGYQYIIYNMLYNSTKIISHSQDGCLYYNSTDGYFFTNQEVWYIDSNNNKILLLGVLGSNVPDSSNRDVTPTYVSSDNNNYYYIFFVTVIPMGLAAALIVIRYKRKSILKPLVATRPNSIYIPEEDIKLQKELGKGSYGKVYLAYYKNNDVAVKIPSQMDYSLEDEIDIIRKLPPHPHVVRVYGLVKFRTSNQTGIVMEYCKNGSLDHIILDQGTVYDMKTKIALMRQISLGLAHLHENNIVHRDLAIRNVLINDNIAKIADFGYARILDAEEGKTKTDVGPLRWMSPESINNRIYSCRSDIWSLAIVFYEILAESEPHVEEDQLKVVVKIRDSGHHPYLPINIPQELRDLIHSCWEFSPLDRPSLAQIVHKLGSFS